MSNIVSVDNSYKFPTWTEMKEQASMLVRSGFLPNTVNTPEKAVAIMLKGKEIGMPTMQAMSQIAVIQGKPVLSPEGQLALIYRNCPGVVINFLQLDDDACVVEAKRPGKEAKFQRFSFTMADAAKAGLASKDNWRKYPRAMLRSRCIGEMARSLFPDAICGISYTPEELGAEVDVTDSGDVVIQTNHVTEATNHPIKQQTGEFKNEVPKTVGSAKAHWRSATEKQINLIRAKANEPGWSEEKLTHILKEIFSTDGIEKIKFNDVNPLLKQILVKPYLDVCKSHKLNPILEDFEAMAENDDLSQEDKSIVIDGDVVSNGELDQIPF